jgi:GNAT superfamily N-acetyltransferase
VNIRPVHSPNERSRLAHAANLPPFDSRQLADHRPDLHLCALSDTGTVEAHASLWWSDTPVFESHRVGVVGHYASANDQAAALLLRAALHTLQEQNGTLAVGPMDGNTWRRYRFVVDAGTEPPFFLEPTNPPAAPQQWERAGFTPLAHYVSAINTDLSQQDQRMLRVAERMEQRGVSIRSARASELLFELSRIYRVSQAAFARNFLYTELSEAAYLAQYEKLLPHIRPEFLLLAERGPELTGFAFAIPDLAQAARGQAMDTLLVKTVAILPDPVLAGLGALLLSQVQQIARQAGFRRCVHALMYEGNVSRNTSLHYATVMRRYAIFSRELHP